jgi:hypothetical protein
MNGKLNLMVGEPLYTPCHNDLNKKSCDNCMPCKDKHCNRSMCDAHNNCQCVRTSCLCQRR